MRFLAPLLAASIITGCAVSETETKQSDRETSALPAFLSLRPAPPAPLESVLLMDGDIHVSGPPGYCIDPVSLRRGIGRGLAVIASCRILSQGDQGFVVEPVMVTISVTKPRKEDTLPSAQGIAAHLDVPLLRAGGDDIVTLAHLGQGGDRILDHGDPRHWRGAMRHNGWLIGLGLYAPKGSALAGAPGADFAMNVFSRIRSNSPENVISGPDVSRVQAPSLDGSAGPNPLQSLWSRLTAPQAE